MAKDVSIMVTARDNYSAVMEKMTKTQNIFNRDLKGLQSQLDTLNKNKVTLKTDFTQASNALKSAKKDFVGTADEANRLQLEAAQADYDNIKQNLDAVSSAAKQTQKDMNNLAGTSSKVQNQLSGSGGGDTLLASLAGAGLIKMFGDTLSNSANVLVGSAFGSDAGTMFSSMLGGITSGAAMGSLTGNPVGTAIGAGIGAVTGIINGLTQNYQKQDDAYRSLVQDTYTEITEGRAASLKSGTTIAGQREIDQISFATLFGDANAAENFLGEVRTMAAATPFGYDTLTKMSKVLSTYGYDNDQILPLLGKVGDAGSALGMSREDMNWVATAIGRMNLTGKTTMEYLNPLIERGIPAINYLAEAMKLSNAEVQDMVRKGLIPGADAAKIISDYMGVSFSGSMAAMSETFQGLTSTVEDLQADVDAAMGLGYNDTRKKGLEDQIAYMEGESGDKLKNANYLIGVWQATLENEQEQALRNAYDQAFAQIEEQGITNEAEMGRILGEAQAEAKAAYLTDPAGAYKTELDAQMALVDSVQEAMRPAVRQGGYDLAQNFSEGFAAGLNFEKTLKITAGIVGGETDSYNVNIAPMGGSAYGMDRVPYDNFPLLLHEGERVLTAAEARRQDAQAEQPLQIVVNIQNMSVRSDDDADLIASQIAERIVQAQKSFIGRTP